MKKKFTLRLICNLPAGRQGLQFAICFSLLTANCLLPTFSFAQANIAAARAMALNSTITITGIVINGSELGTIRYIEDSTAGISAYSTTMSNVKRGDSITLTGTLTDYQTLLEIQPVTSFTVHSSNNALPAPFVLTPSQLAEPYESELVQINNVTFANGGGTFAGNTGYNFTSNAQTAAIYVKTGSPLVGQIIPSTAVTLIGVEYEYSSVYQVLPRDMNDIIINSSIFLTSQPAQTNITTTGFALNWTTNISGSTYIEYGTDTTLNLGIVNGTGGTVNHTVSLTGLTSATIYYAKVFSVNGNDTASSALRVFCTQSLSSGKIKAYFDRTVDTTVSTGTNAVQLSNTIPDTLSAYISRAKYTLDIAIYNFSIASIATAINNAYSNGVKVRIVADGSTSNSALASLNVGIKIIASPQGGLYTIMHNKFVIIDANSPNPDEPIVWTGSTNWTTQQVNTDANNVIIIQDQSLARGYKLEFEEMFGDTGLTPNSTNARFGLYKKDNTPHEYIIGGKRVESYFSPSDNVNAQILSAINTADKDIEFCMLTFTRSDLAYAVSDRITNNGVSGKAVVDTSTTTSTGSAYTTLQTAMGSSIHTYHEGGLMHHKYVIIDQSDTASDPLVLTGSHNWSNAANQSNDENTVVVHDATIANVYLQEFTKRYNSSTGPSAINEMQDAGYGIQVYPNPNDGRFQLAIGSLQSAKGKTEIKILNLLGEIIYSSTINHSTSNIDLTNQPNGIYFLHLQTQEGTTMKKLIINN